MTSGRGRHVGVGLTAMVAAGIVTATANVRAHPPSIVNQAAEKVVADEVRAFRKDMAAAIEAKNERRLRDMYAPSFVHTHPSGKREARDGRIAMALSGVMLIERETSADVEIRLPIDWVAIVTGERRDRAGDADAPRTIRWTAVYTRTDKSWWLVATHETWVSDTKR